MRRDAVSDQSIFEVFEQKFWKYRTVLAATGTSTYLEPNSCMIIHFSQNWIMNGLLNDMNYIIEACYNYSGEDKATRGARLGLEFHSSLRGGR
jgi:hypothetical protein